MWFPPSLPRAVLARAFRADNGELGLCLADAPRFLSACEADDVALLAWELWIVDHRWPATGAGPERAPGQWCGLIPGRDPPLPCVVHGKGDAAACRAQLAELDLHWVEPGWADYIRVNFTLDED